MGKIVVFGATGRVGSALVRELISRGADVRAVVRDLKKAATLPKDAEVVKADIFNTAEVGAACEGADMMFVLTPENPMAQDVFADALTIIGNYRLAAENNRVRRVVALSSMGAKHAEGTGNLVVSHMLEKAFGDYDGQVTFIRPGYYYSNWMHYLELAREHGILPTSFPPELPVGMIAPEDVASFAADVISGKYYERIYEICGPFHNSREVADIFGEYLEREVVPMETPRDRWEESLLEVGFSADAAQKFAQMTGAVVDGLTGVEWPDKMIKVETDLSTYLRRR